MMRQIFLASTLFSGLILFGCGGEDSSPLGSTALTGRETSSSSALAGASASSQQAPVENFVAPLSPDQEVPPADSQETGLAKFQLRGDELNYHLNVSRMEGVTQAHIHCGAPGVNGPVVVFLFGFVPTGVTANGRLASGTITAADVIPRPDSAECPGGVANFEELLAKMRAGDTYANVHTLEFPGGEVRGQIDRGNGTN